MPSTRDIRQRIRSIRNIQQITRAMEMIASARLRRVQQRAEKGRPFADGLTRILGQVVGPGVDLEDPLLNRRPVRRAGILAVTSTRGLCGGYNANVMNHVRRVWDERVAEGAEVILYLVGSKGLRFASRWQMTVAEQFEIPGIEVTLEDIGRISNRVVGDYGSGEVDRVDLVYTTFVTTGNHPTGSLELLPIEPPADVAAPCRFEPDPALLLGRMLPLYLEVSIYRALVESMASEQAARMVAMHNATDSADEMITTLSKTYNRARQGAITTEILEVSAGAEALLHQQD